MDIAPLIDRKELRKINFLKYKGIPPSPDLIDTVVEKSGLKMLARFEFVYGIFKNALTWHKNGIQELPARYWHIFYDFDSVSQIYNKIQKTNKRHKNKRIISRINNPLLDAQRSSL